MRALSLTARTTSWNRCIAKGPLFCLRWSYRSQTLNADYRRITEIGPTNPLFSISSDLEDLWPTSQRLERPTHRNVTMYRQDDVSYGPTVPGSNRHQGKWPASPFSWCVYSSHGGQPMNHFLFRSLVLHGGYRVPYTSVIPFHSISTLSASGSFLSTCSRVQMSFNVVVFELCMAVFSIVTWSTSCGRALRFPSPIGSAVFRKYFQILFSFPRIPCLTLVQILYSGAQWRCQFMLYKRRDYSNKLGRCQMLANGQSAAAVVSRNFYMWRLRSTLWLLYAKGQHGMLHDFMHDQTNSALGVKVQRVESLVQGLLYDRY